MGGARINDRLEHRWTRRRLADYLDESLAPAKRRRVERHAAGCPQCGPLLRSLAIVIATLRSLGRGNRRSVAPAVIDRLRREAPEGRSR